MFNTFFLHRYIKHGERGIQQFVYRRQCNDPSYRIGERGKSSFSSVVDPDPNHSYEDIRFLLFPVQTGEKMKRV